MCLGSVFYVLHSKFHVLRPTSYVLRPTSDHPIDSHTLRLLPHSLRSALLRLCARPWGFGDGRVVTMVSMMRLMVSSWMTGRGPLRSTAMKSRRYTAAGALAISFRPVSSTFLDAATTNMRMPSSRARSAVTLMPPQGLPVTWPSVMTTAKRRARGSEGARLISSVMLLRAQSM